MEQQLRTPMNLCQNYKFELIDRTYIRRILFTLKNSALLYLLESEDVNSYPFSTLRLLVLRSVLVGRY